MNTRRPFQVFVCFGSTLLHTLMQSHAVFANYTGIPVFSCHHFFRSSYIPVSDPSRGISDPLRFQFPIRLMESPIHLDSSFRSVSPNLRSSYIPVSDPSHRISDPLKFQFPIRLVVRNSSSDPATFQLHSSKKFHDRQPSARYFLR